MKKYITKKWIVYTFLPLFMVGIIFVENPAKAVSFTYSTYNAGDILYRFPSSVSAEYGQLDHIEDGGPDGDIYYYIWHLDLPISIRLTADIYHNGYSTLALNWSRSFGYGSTMRSFNCYLTDAVFDDYYSNISTVGTNATRAYINTRYINTKIMISTEWIPLGTFHIDLMATSSSAYETLTLTLSGHSDSSDQFVTYTTDPKNYGNYNDILEAIENSNDIDGILYYLISLATYGAQINIALDKLNFEQIVSLINNTGQIITNTQNIDNRLQGIGGQIANIYNLLNIKLSQLLAINQSQYDMQQDIYEEMSRYFEEQASRNAAESSQGEAIGDTAEQAGQSLEDLGSQLEVATGDPEDWLNDMSNAVNQEAMNQQGNVFQWTENSRIIMYLTIVFTFGLIGYLLYGRN